MAESELIFSDIQRAFDTRDSRLGPMICAYALQPDPPETAVEGFDFTKKKPPALPRDAWTIARVRQSFNKWSMHGKSDDEKKAIRREAWRGLQSADHPPPRLGLGDMLIALYDLDDDRVVPVPLPAKAELSSRRFEFSDGSSNKFWSIDLSGSEFTVIYGRIGTDGRAQTKTFDSDDIATREAEKLINSKVKKGYVEVGSVSAAAQSATASTPTKKHAGAKATDTWARGVLMHVFANVRIGWGVWRGIKQIYKTAEERFDAEVFGILAWRFDVWFSLSNTGEISGGTYAYLRRRAWRFLRHLGASLPELYPSFAVEVLRHYRVTQKRLYGTWVVAQIWAHEDLIGAFSSWVSEPPKDLTRRAFNDAWKLSPDPLLRLLEDAQNDHVLQFAINGLRADFPDVVHRVEPEWLRRIGRRPQATLHRFVVELLEASPQLHQSKLKGLGLHDMVVGLLKSPNADAAKYAVDYTNAHAPNLSDDFLVDIAAAPQSGARDLALARLQARQPSDLGLERLLAMLKPQQDALTELAKAKLIGAFKPQDLSQEQYQELRLGNRHEQAFVKEFYAFAKLMPPAAYLIAAADSTKNHRWILEIMRELGKHKGEAIGMAFVKRAMLENAYRSFAQKWVRDGKFEGAALDVEWLKGLVMRQSTRAFAVEILSKRKLVAPHRVGLPWLLAMSRQADPLLADFAATYLLQHFAPTDFADGGGEEAGITKIWSLMAPGQPDPARKFAASYLRLHHPQLGPRTETAQRLGVEPRLSNEHYGSPRVRPLFDDATPEIRRFAVDMARYEIHRWGEAELPYRLATSRHSETRRFGLSTLLTLRVDAEELGEDPWRPLEPIPMEWLDAGEVFALTESANKSCREAAMTLLRRHYDRIGGATRLGWLMESPERDVRLFAVRLLWDHRGEFEGTEALRQFLRTVLFGLPPGRMERRADGALGERSLPASVAKRRLVDVVRDMSLESREFAVLALPVLEEFMVSQAKGEWHACVTALARIRRAHSLGEALPAARAQSAGPQSQESQESPPRRAAP